MTMDGGPELHHLPGFYEPFNAISHLLATVVFLVLGWKLVGRGRGSRTRVLFLAIYSSACVFLLSTSAVFHMMVRGGTASRVLERLDHGAIFVLIAGTFTGVHGIVFQGWFRWVPLIIVWCVAAACITLKTVFFESLPEWVGLSSTSALLGPWPRWRFRSSDGMASRTLLRCSTAAPPIQSERSWSTCVG